MKIRLLLLSSIFFITLFACKSSDDDTPSQSDRVSFPLTAGNYWNYDETNEMGTFRDSLYVVSAEESGNETMADLDAQQPATSFMVTLLAQSDVTQNPTQLKISGSLSAPVDGLPDLEIPFSDIILYDYDGAFDGSTISSASGEIERIIEEIPLVISYEISTRQIALGIGDDFDNGIAYYFPTTELVVNLEIVAEIEVGGFVIPVPILTPQDVLVATNDFYQETGLIQSDVIVTYELEDLSAFGIDLPFPPSDTRQSSATLDTFLAN